MSRYVNADKVLEALDELYDDSDRKEVRKGIMLAKQAVCAITDTHEVAHGRWLKPTKPLPYYDWRCSICGCEEYRQRDSHGCYREMSYCPNCGARNIVCREEKL